MARSLVLKFETLPCNTALGAVGIAALGVVGVYQMSSWVADKSGRSMDADATGLPGPPIVLSAELLKARKVTFCVPALSAPAADYVKQAFGMVFLGIHARLHAMTQIKM